MNRKQFGILILLVIVLGGAGWFLRQSQNQTATAGEQGTGQKLLGNSFPVNDVAEIRLAQGTNQVNLKKKQDLWKVAERMDYHANFASISDLLLKIRDLKIVQKDDVTEADLAKLQLAPAGQGANAGLVVEFKDANGKTITSLTLGKKHTSKPQAQQMQMGMGDMGFPDGRYVQTGGNSKIVYLIADALNSVEPNISEWLNKDFFKIERVKFISVTHQVETNSWAIKKGTESGEWELVDPKGDEKLDAARVSGVSSPFSSPSFDDVVPLGGDATKLGLIKSDVLLDKPTVIKIETFDDFVYTIKVGAKTDEKYPIQISVVANFPKERIPAKDEKPEDKTKADKAWADRQKQLETQLADTKHFENWVYLVPTYSVDSVLKDRKDLLVEKKAETNPAETTDTLKAEPFVSPEAPK